MNESQLKAAIAEAAGNVHTEAGKSAVAEIITKTVNPNFLTLDIFSSFMPTRRWMPGDNPMIKVRKGKYAVRSMVPNTNHLTSQVYRQDKQSFVFDQLIAGTSCNLYELRSGDLGTVAQMRRELRQSVEETIAVRVFNLLTTVWNSTDTPLNYTDATSTGITRTILDNMIEEVIERAGGVRAIMGARKALNPIYDFATSVPVTVVTGQSGTAIPTPQFTEFYTRNMISTYKGIPMVEIRQQFADVLPDVREKQIRTDVVLVIGEDPGQIALMGNFEYQDYTDFRTQPANYVLHGWQQYGLIVDAPDRIGVVQTNT